MRFPKATLRQSGFRMMTTTITVHIDIHDIVRGLAHATTTESEFMDGLESVTRTHAFTLAKKVIVVCDEFWYPEANENVDLDEDDITRIKDHAAKLFPELAEDLTDKVSK